MLNYHTSYISVSHLPQPTKHSFTHHPRIIKNSPNIKAITKSANSPISQKNYKPQKTVLYLSDCTKNDIRPRNDNDSVKVSGR